MYQDLFLRRTRVLVQQSQKCASWQTDWWVVCRRVACRATPRAIWACRQSALWDVCAACCYTQPVSASSPETSARCTVIASPRAAARTWVHTHTSRRFDVMLFLFLMERRSLTLWIKQTNTFSDPHPVMLLNLKTTNVRLISWQRCCSSEPRNKTYDLFVRVMNSTQLKLHFRNGKKSLWFKHWSTFLSPRASSLSF